MAKVVVVCGKICGEMTKRQKDKKTKMQKGKKTKRQEDKKTKRQQKNKRKKDNNKKDKNRGPEGLPCPPQELEKGGHRPPKFYLINISAKILKS